MADRAHSSTAHRSGTTALAGLLLSGVLILAACGSSDKDDDAETTGSTTATASGTSGAPAAAGALDAGATSGTPSDPMSTDAAAASGAPGSDSAAPGGENAAGGSHASGSDGAAGDGGASASGDDSSQITALVKGLNGDKPLADFMQYNFDHTCTAYVDAHGGRDNARTDIDGMREKNQMLSELGMVSDITDVADIVVTGDNATATVSGTVGGQPSSSQQQFLRENGTWTMCPAS